MHNALGKSNLNPLYPYALVRLLKLWQNSRNHKCDLWPGVSQNQYQNQNSFICPSNGDISVSQQPKGSNITINNNNSKNKQFDKKVRNRNRFIYILYT